jgi:hypothetical protein
MSRSLRCTRAFDRWTILFVLSRRALIRANNSGFGSVPIGAGPSFHQDKEKNSPRFSTRQEWKICVVLEMRWISVRLATAQRNDLAGSGGCKSKGQPVSGGLPFFAFTALS